MRAGDTKWLVSGKQVEILSLDSNPRVAVLVVETANRDKSHLVLRGELH